MSSTQLYLDLLKKVTTDTVYQREPDAESGHSRYVLDVLQHYVQGPAITLLPVARLDHLQSCIEEVLRAGIAGDVMEAGVWRGGATIVMRATLKAHGVTDRRVWAADSFEGLPEPDAQRFPKEAAAHNGPVMRDAFKHLAASLEEVRANFARFGLLDPQVCFLKGWFKDTLPSAPIERLALLRLDGDYYESTRDCLVNLYDKVSAGGYLIVDDYGEDTWTYCRQAVDEFRAERGCAEPMVQVDRSCWYWRKAG
jgi:hypothetical protein